MGTHISRVKSVDLDSWTDEQLQSILSWGNARANKYWEAKLATGHAPSEAKIENFIRTKYELKRWAMEGPVPDPATLGAEGDDEVPLSIVKEKQVIDSKQNARKESSQPAQFDLIGGPDPAPSRQAAPPTAKAAPAPPKATTTKDSLLGLDFLGEPSAPPRPSSTAGSTSSAGQSRPDLKQSILSLYASAPKAPVQSQQNTQQQNAFGNTASATQSSAGGFNDAFGGLSLSNTTSPKPVAADPFASFGGSSASSKPAAPQASNNSFGGLSGGGFFNAAPAQPAAPTHQPKPSSSGFSDFGGFASAPAPAPTQSKPAQSSSAMSDLFDLSAPVSQTSPPPINPTSPPSSSVFNLSQPKPTPAPAAPSTIPTASVASGADVWGDNAWGSPAAPPAAPVSKSPQATKAAPAASADFGWGSGGGFASTPIVPGAAGGFNPAPKVAADEEFGTWTSSTGGTTAGAGAGTSQSGGGNDDLFSNVWQ